eukprot:g5501.t1
MAGLTQVIEIATGTGDCASSPQVRSPRSRSKESGDGDDISRGWTRSQSPLRQLLSASNSRPSSPTSKSNQGGRDYDGDDCKAPAVIAGAAAGVATVSSDGVRSVLQQQQRVCLKNVLHPVSYDECHIPSDEQDGGGGNDGCDSGHNGNPAPGTAVSAKGVVSAP